MKKITSILLALIFVLSLTACGNSSAGGNNAAQNSSASADNAQADKESVDNKGNSAQGKAIVVYYSATGSTKAAAEAVADAAGADLFEIMPVDIYTDDDLNWRDDNSRVSVEHNDESKRNVPLAKTTPDNWNDYDTVFIGYPIWWGIAAWPVNNFVKDNDFSGKKVIPFCTSASSGIGQSGELLAEMAGSGDWQVGERFSSAVDSATVEEWVNGLGL